nr:MAG TPA: hypothetical protein [Caudoviricetes sp.]
MYYILIHNIFVDNNLSFCTKYTKPSNLEGFIFIYMQLCTVFS